MPILSLARSFTSPYTYLISSIRPALLVAAAMTACSATSAMADIVSWTNWTSFTSGTSGSALGSLAVPSGPSVSVSYSGEVSSPTQVSGGTNYWRSDTAYRSGLVSNGPGESGNTDIIALTGQSTNPITNTILFSSPVTNPILAILSLGRPGFTVRYTFGQDFSILSSGTGFFGGSASGSLFRDSFGVLRGAEGHGVILFPGTFSSISWQASPAEFWHGFQVGVVPSPSAAALLGLGGLMAARRRR